MTSPTSDRRQGLVGNTPIKAPIDLATTANITLSGEQVIDGVMTNASRVLVKDQTNPVENGIYDTSSAAWTRSRDADGAYDLVKGSRVYVTDGTQALTEFLLTAANPVTVNTSPLTWFQSLTATFVATLSAAAGAGMIGFYYLTSYAARTLGWGLKLGSVKVAWFEDNVVAGDWAPALQAAHDLAASLPNGGVVELATDRLYACVSGLTWNTNKVGLRGNGAILDFSDFTDSGGVGIDIRQSDGDPNVRGTLNSAHPFDNVIFLGPGGSHLNTAVRGLDTNLIGGNPWMAGVTFRGCAFRNWWRDVELNAGTFLWRFEGCRFSISGTDVTYDASIYMPFATNSGENTVFDHCFFGKVYGTVFRQVNSNASTRFVNCSADYNDRIFDVQGGRVEWDGYIESDRDNNYWATVGAENAFLRIAGPVVLTNATPKTFELFAVDPAGTNGGLDLDIELAIGGGGGMGTLNLCKGLTAATSGRVVCRLRSHSKVTAHPAIGGGCTVLANGDFETAALTDWTLSGAVTPPEIVTSPAGHSGTSCLRFAGSSTNVPGAVRMVPCRAGQQAAGSLWYQTQGLAGTSGTFFITLTYVDAGGATLSAATELSTQLNVSTYTFLNVSQQQPAPPGTVAAVLSIQLFGTTTGAPNGYISDPTFAVV